MNKLKCGWQMCCPTGPGMILKPISLSPAECESEKAVKPSSSSLTRLYHCDICNKDLTLTSTEILKHKRQHTVAS